MINNNTLIKSTLWSAVAEILVKVASPIANIILARLLAPEIFGLVATFMVVISFAEIFTDGGFQKFLIQHEFKDYTDKDQCINVAFWSNLILSFFCWIFIFIFQCDISRIVGCPGHGFEIAILSLQIPLFSLSSIQQSLYRREFRYKELVPIRLIVSLVPLFLTVFLAFILKNCWAVIIGNLAKEFVNASLLMYKSTWKPKLSFSLSKLNKMMPFCFWLMSDSFMIWLTSYAGVLIVSHKLNLTYLGIYQIGTTTILQYLNIIAAITQPIIFSALSRSQSDINQCNILFANYIKYVAYIVFPFGFSIGLYSDLVTIILLGDNWIEASTVIACLGFTFPLGLLIGQYNSYYFRALGKPKLALTVQTIYSALMIVFMLWAVEKSFYFFSIVAGSISVIYVLISNTALKIVFNFPYKVLFQGWLPILTAIIFMIVASMLMKFYSKDYYFSFISWFVSLFVYVFILISIPSSRNDLFSFVFYFKGKI